MVDAHEPEETMQQLTERFETIRSETEEVTAQILKDAEDFKQQMAELAKEKEEKRQILKEKEEASEKLKKELHNAERVNRQAQMKRQQKEKILKDKQAERVKMQEDIARWRQEIVDMKKEEKMWHVEKERLAIAHKAKMEELGQVNKNAQEALVNLEEEIRVKGLAIKELEADRQQLPGEQDDEEKEREAQEKRNDQLWEQKEREINARLQNQLILLRNSESEYKKAQENISYLTTRQANNALLYQSHSSGVDYDPGNVKHRGARTRHRKSRSNTMSSPATGYPSLDGGFSGASAYNTTLTTSPSFAPGPYFDLSSAPPPVAISEQLGISDADARGFMDGASLSPTATALLPSNIFSDDEPYGQSLGTVFAGYLPPAYDETEPQSPTSSASHSASRYSSPRTSSHNLEQHAGSREGTDLNRRSAHSPGADFGPIGSASTAVTQSGPSKRFDFFSLAKRGKTMPLPNDGLALGSLKGQSHSFPRQTDEPEALANRHRRTSFSSGWNVMPSFLSRNAAVGGEVAEGNGPAPARMTSARRRRNFNMFGSNLEGSDPTSLYTERDPSSPRPASIASSDLPRPSTDSAPFGWPAAETGMNRNSPLATNWSVNAPQQWPHFSSRRQSIQQGSTTALSQLITEDDDFLPPDSLYHQTSPPPVGVIGTRPTSARQPETPKLNPAAPTFTTFWPRSSKGDKSASREHGKSMAMAGAADEPTHYFDDMSPPSSRVSRDARSINTQHSLAESYDSLSLNQSLSNTPSDVTAPSAKDKESSFQKLLRKGSSSKFSFSSIRNKDALFGNKGRNASGDRSEVDEDAESALARSIDSVGGGYMSQPVGAAVNGQAPATPGASGKDSVGRSSISWGRFGLKKGKARRESVGEGKASETEGTEDEEHV